MNHTPLFNNRSARMTLLQSAELGSVAYFMIMLISAAVACLPFTISGFGSNVTFPHTYGSVDSIVPAPLFASSITAVLGLFAHFAVEAFDSHSRSGSFHDVLFRCLILIILLLPLLISASLLQNENINAVTFFVCNYSFKFVGPIGSTVLFFNNKVAERSLACSSSVVSTQRQLDLLLVVAVVFQVCFFAACSSLSTQQSLLMGCTLLNYLICIQQLVMAGTIFFGWFRRGDKASSKDEVSSYRYIGLLVLWTFSDQIVLLNHSPLSVSIYLHLAFSAAIIYWPRQVEHSKQSERVAMELSEKTALLWYISNEVRSQLNINELGVQFIKSEITPAKSALSWRKAGSIVDALDDVDTSNKTAISVLDDFLIMENVKADKVELSLQDLEPKILFLNACKEFDQAGREKALTYTYAIEEQETQWTDQYWLKADPGLLGLALRHLLSNAIKFTPEGGTVSIKLSVANAAIKRDTAMVSRSNTVVPIPGDSLEESSSKMLRLAIVESGTGIAGSSKERLFGLDGEAAYLTASGLEKGELGLWISKGERA